MAFDRPRIRETEELRREPVRDLDRQGPQEAADEELDATYAGREETRDALLRADADEDFGPVEDDWPQEPHTPEAETAAQRHAAEAIAEYQRQQAEAARQEAERRRRSADLDRLAGRSEQRDQSPEDRRRRDTQQALRAGIAPTEPRAPEARRSEGQQQLDAQAHSVGRQPEGRNEAATLRPPAPQASPTPRQQTPSGPRPGQVSGPAPQGSGPAQRASGPARQGSGQVQRPAAVAGNFQPTAEQIRRSEAQTAQWIQQAQQTEARLMSAHATQSAQSAQPTDPRIADAQQALRVGLPPQRPPGAPQAPAQHAQPAPGQAAARTTGRSRPGNNRGSSGHRHEL